MTDDRITVKITGQEDLFARFGRVGKDAPLRVRRTLQMLGLMLVSYIQTSKLAGQRLYQRSGRLVSSVHEETVQTANTVTTTVGTNVKYARPHEYGFTGTVQIKAHMRMIKQAWGKPITPREVLVRAHPVKMNIGEKRMFRDSLAEFQPKVVSKLSTLAKSLAEEAMQ